MVEGFREYLRRELRGLTEAGMYKSERIITSPQNAWITLQDGRRVLNLCANNYLALASHPEVIEAAKLALQQRGLGLASVRFICGTQDLHKELEKRISEFFGTDDTILYSSGFDANTGLFETLLGEEDGIISDELNHASIIDGIRLCKATRYRYRHGDMGDLEAKLQEAAKQRFRLIATDGVFSMDGDIADLKSICALAKKHDALVMVDDAHAAGFLGKTGRGTPEHCGVMGQVDIITGTLGKAFGGASGGYTTGRKEIIEMLRQRSRPYLFSNTLAPAIAAASLKVFDLLSSSTRSRDGLMHNAQFFREELGRLGFQVKPGTHPIMPIMLGDAAVAQKFATKMLERSVYVVGFSYPVVPKGQARIRTQISTAHRPDDLHFALEKFDEVKREMGI
jgi:glycine C-acetyltransferase